MKKYIFLFITPNLITSLKPKPNNAFLNSNYCLNAIRLYNTTRCIDVYFNKITRENKCNGYKVKGLVRKRH